MIQCLTVVVGVAGLLLAAWASVASISEVRGFGHHKGPTATYRGVAYPVDSFSRAKIEMVVPDAFVDPVLSVFCRTGEHGERAL